MSTRIRTLGDLDRATQPLGGLCESARQLSSRFGASRAFNEDAKLAHYPELTEENIARVRELLGEAIDLLEKVQVWE